MNRDGKGQRGVVIAGVGSYLPERILTNADLTKIVDTSDEWIRTRTGISERRIARDDQATSDLAAEASRHALTMAGLAAEDVEMIVVGTVTPDMVFPNTACFVQKHIGARKAFCFDLEAACSGFLYSLETARQFVASGTVKNALVIGAEKLSCVMDWQDRTTCVLFGDGAGAVVLKPATTGRGILGTVMGSDGTLAELLTIPGGGSRTPVSAQSMADRMHYMKMAGKDVFKHAVRCMTDAAQQVLARCGLSADDVTCVIPHQANLRIVQAVSDRLGIGTERFCINLDRVGNISAASVPVALDEAVRANRFKDGDRLLFVTFGGGFTWGATLVEWGV